MKTPLELAAEHARAYADNRGWRVKPLSWEEVELLVDAAETSRVNEFDHDDCHHDTYHEGYEDGYDEGYEDGRAEADDSVVQGGAA